MDCIKLEYFAKIIFIYVNGVVDLLISNKTENYKLYESRIYGRAVVVNHIQL